MKKWIIVFVIVAVLAGTVVYVFLERPLVPEGYTIERVESGISIGDGTSTGSAYIDWGSGRTMLQYNAAYPNGYREEFLTISTDELETILKTAGCRMSVRNYAPFFQEDVKYQFVVQLVNGDKVRHLVLCLGKNSWYSNGGRICYDIQDAGELIAALDAAKTIEQIY